MRIPGALGFVGVTALSLALPVNSAVADSKLLDLVMTKGTLNFEDEEFHCHGLSWLYQGFYNAPADFRAETQGVADACGAVIWNSLNPKDPRKLPESVRLTTGEIVPVESEKATRAMAKKMQSVVESHSVFPAEKYSSYQVWLDREGKHLLVRKQADLEQRVKREEFFKLAVAYHQFGTREPVAVHVVGAFIGSDGALWIAEPGNHQRKLTQGRFTENKGTIWLSYEMMDSQGRKGIAFWNNVYVNEDYHVLTQDVFIHPKQ